MSPARPYRPSIDESFYDIDPVLGCWVWKRCIHRRSGYPQVSFKGRRSYGHRAVYEERVGPIPAGMQLDHLCGRPACVNPDHLEPVTPAENTRRSRTAKLTEDDVRQIKRLGGKATLREIATQFGVYPNHVWKILNGQHWSDVEDAT